jgi:hypothetical protein
MMTEVDARNVLEICSGIGVFERWMADQPWQEVPGGWQVSGALNDWHFQLSPVLGGIRVTASSSRSEIPAVWTVLNRS